MKGVRLAEGEYYHVFNRGVDKRDIFLDSYDLDRFIESIRVFNREETVGSIFEQRLQKHRRFSFGSSTPKEPLTELVAYCLNPNHFHLLLRQRKERGIERFMQRLGTGYTNYFNEKNRRTGALFQGRYKAVHIESNEQLLHTSVYVNFNNRFGSSTPKLSRSSSAEYCGSSGDLDLCSTAIILEQFPDASSYQAFAESSLEMIVKRKQEEKELSLLFGS